MSKLTCMEAVFEVLAGRATAGLDHECFDDLVMACYALASGESSEPDVVAWIAAHDQERSPEQICLDICDYFRRCNSGRLPSAVMAEAVAAGRRAR